MLDEPDIRRFFPEALPADVQAVLADQAGGMSADAARPTALPVGARARVPD